jgi:HD-GYP domain-containing protein (c-di-GMP phosphodiesterase class II)
MSPTPDHDRAQGPASPPPEDRLREQGLQLVTLLSAVIRIGRAYSVTNQVFRTQLESIYAALRGVLQHAPEVAMVALDSDIYLNGVRIPVNSSNFRFQQTVVELFRSRRVSGFRVDPEVMLGDLERFFELFLGPTDIHGQALIEACAAANVQHIFPALHASTDPVDDDEAGNWAAGTEAAETDATDGQDSGRKAASSAGRAISISRGAGRKYYSKALQGARSLLTTTALTSGLEMRHAKRVVQPLVDGAFASEPVVVGLSTLHEHDEYTYSHAVNVCAIAVTMGHFLGLDRRTLADLGVAALLHDVGKSAVSDRILHPLGAFTQEERAAAELHPLEGAKLLARSTSLNSTTLRCIRVALEHHSAPAGKAGYPAFRPGWRGSLLSQIVAVADCFMNLHTRCGELVENITPCQALGMILGPLRERFEPALLWALVQSVGFYPPGQVVELGNGEIALVVAPDKHDLARPHVRVIARRDRKLLSEKHVRELHPLPPEMTIRRALRGEEYPTESAEPEAAEAA